MTITISGDSPNFTSVSATTVTGVTTLNSSSGVLATQNGMSGIAKAWVSFNGANGSIYASFNVSSVTRNSTGKYTIVFATAMPDANYATTISMQPTVTNIGDSSFAINPTSTQVEMWHFEANIARDSAYSCCTIFR